MSILNQIIKDYRFRKYIPEISKDEINNLLLYTIRLEDKIDELNSMLDYTVFDFIVSKDRKFIKKILKDYRLRRIIPELSQNDMNKLLKYIIVLQNELIDLKDEMKPIECCCM